MAFFEGLLAELRTLLDRQRSAGLLDRRQEVSLESIFVDADAMKACILALRAENDALRRSIGMGPLTAWFFVPAGLRQALEAKETTVIDDISLKSAYRNTSFWDV